MNVKSCRAVLSAAFFCAAFLTHVPSICAQNPPAKSPAAADLYGDPLPAGAIARLGSVRFHHPAGLFALAFAPDSKSILAVGTDAVRFWETETGKELSRFEIDKEPRFQGIRNVKFSPNGNYVAFHNNRVELLDRHTGKPVRSFGKEGGIISCAFSPDGKLLAAGSMEWLDDNPIRVWEVETGKELAPFPGRGVSLHALTFSADGKRLFSGPPGGSYQKPSSRGVSIPAFICVWDVETRKTIRVIDHAQSNVAFALNGELLAYEDEGIRVVAVATGKTVCRIEAKNPSFAFTPDSKAVAALDNERVMCLWDANTGKELRRFSGHIGQQARLSAFSPDGKRLALMDGHWSLGGTIRLWDVANGGELRPGGGHEDVVSHLAFAPGGKLIASASWDRSVRIWEAATGKEIHRLDGHTAPVFAVAFAPDGKTLASLGDDGSTRLWDVASGEQLALLKNPPGRKEEGFVLGQLSGGGTLAFSTDGKTLTAAGSNGMVATWDWLTRKEIRRLVLNRESFTRPVLVPCVNGILTATSGGWAFDENVPAEMLYLWALPSGTIAQAMPLRSARENGTSIIVEALAASADGRMLASSQIVHSQGLRIILTNPAMRLWERVTGREILAIKETMGHALAFSPNGRLLAADDGQQQGWAFRQDATVSLWDTWTGERQSKLTGHTGPVHCIAFSPDGKTLATGSADHTILIWTTPPLKAPVANPAPPTAKQVQAWWTELGGDAAIAHRASGNLARNPQPAVQVIQDKLKPVVPIDPKKLPPLIRDLDSPDFEVRNEAYGRLEAMGDLAALALRQALEKPASLEAKRRLELLLNSASGVTAGYVHGLRALAVLERIGSPEARQVIEAIGKGAPGARLTEEAHVILRRLPVR